MSAKKIPITPIFMGLPTVAQVVAMSTATIERLEREGQFPKRRQLSGRRSGRLRHFLRRPSCRQCRSSSSLSCWRIALGAVSAMRWALSLPISRTRRRMFGMRIIIGWSGLSSFH